MKNNDITKNIDKTKNIEDYNATCWIHLKDLRFFLYLGANPFEEKIGQNIKVNLSIKIKYTQTEDKLENTTDYGAVCQFLKEKIAELYKIKLLEFLAETLLIAIGEKFPNILKAKITIQKAYVPLENFTGTATINAKRIFKF